MLMSTSSRTAGKAPLHSDIAATSASAVTGGVTEEDPRVPDEVIGITEGETALY